MLHQKHCVPVRMQGVQRTRPAKIGQYYGESSRSLREREAEHHDDFLSGRPQHRWLHCAEEHPELLESKEDPFTISIVKAHRTAFHRLVHGALIISEKGEACLNRKEEYSRNLLPKLTLETRGGEGKGKEKQPGTCEGGTETGQNQEPMESTEKESQQKEGKRSKGKRENQ